MTDNDIIKALEDLLKNFDGKAVDFMTISFALDLVKNQKAEIDELRKIFVFGRYTSPTLIRAAESWDRTNSEYIKRLKEENERLQKENNQFADIGKMYSEIKTEAVKEFIDKLIDVAVCKDNGDGTERLFVSTQKIREVAKEMAGERQCEQ